MVEDKINPDILAIVCRWKWQLMINDINREYHELFVLNEEQILETRQREEEYDDVLGNYVGEAVDDPLFYYNWRDMGLLHRDIVSEWWDDCYIEISNWTSLAHPVFVATMSRNPQLTNYVYTSTKYLREIKERGVKCLIDNV